MESVTFEKLTGNAHKPRLEAFLRLSDTWTEPALSYRVVLLEFAEKILLNGHAILAVSADARDVGLAAFYCNDDIRHRAYLTHLAVEPAYRSRGLGRALLDQARKHCSSVGMTSMQLEVYLSNEAAIRFYVSCGFVKSHAEGVNLNLPNSICMGCSL